MEQFTPLENPSNKRRRIDDTDGNLQGQRPDTFHYGAWIPLFENQPHQQPQFACATPQTQLNADLRPVYLSDERPPAVGFDHQSAVSGQAWARPEPMALAAQQAQVTTPSRVLCPARTGPPLLPATAPPYQSPILAVHDLHGPDLTVPVMHLPVSLPFVPASLYGPQQPLSLDGTADLPVAGVSWATEPPPIQPVNRHPLVCFGMVSLVTIMTAYRADI